MLSLSGFNLTSGPGHFSRLVIHNALLSLCISFISHIMGPENVPRNKYPPVYVYYYFKASQRVRVHVKM